MLFFYSEERLHQALGIDTQSKVYSTAIGGGAMMLEKNGIAGEAAAPATTTAIPTATPETGQRRAAACAVKHSLD